MSPSFGLSATECVAGFSIWSLHPAARLSTICGIADFTINLSFPSKASPSAGLATTFCIAWFPHLDFSKSANNGLRFCFILSSNKKPQPSPVISKPLPLTGVLMRSLILRPRQGPHPEAEAISQHQRLEPSTISFLKNKMQPANPNAHTYVNVTDVETHGYAVT